MFSLFQNTIGNVNKIPSLNLNQNVYCVFFGIIWIKNNLKIGIDEG